MCSEYMGSREESKIAGKQTAYEEDHVAEDHGNRRPCGLIIGFLPLIRAQGVDGEGPDAGLCRSRNARCFHIMPLKKHGWLWSDNAGLLA